MSRPARALLALALAASAGRTLAAAPPEVRLLSPAAGSTLVAGSRERLAWEPVAPLAAAIEEWEAFLSLDGGRTYPVRLTPHLDRERRSIAFEVPALPSDGARLLLRFGDERTEVGVEMPERLRIVAGPLASLPPWRDTAPVRGEAARPGDRGVLYWVTGSRDGRGTRSQRGSGPAPLAAPAQLLAGSHAVVGEAPRDPRPPRASTARAAVVVAREARPPSRALVSPRSADLRLEISRRNE